MSIEDIPATAVSQRRRGPGRRLIAAVAAVVVLAAGGTYLGLRLSAGSGPPTSGLATMWTARSLLGDSCATDQPWTADGLAVACSGNGVLTAYRLATGRVAWMWRTPKAPPSLLAGPDGQAGKPVPAILQMSASTDDGIGVFTYTYGDGTAGVVGIDIASGRQLWLLPPSVQVWSSSNIWEGDGRVAILTGLPSTGASGLLQVYDLTTGALDWSSGSQHIPPAGCNVYDDAITGQWLYAVTYCSAGQDELYQMSVRTGSVIAQAPLQDASCKAGSDQYPTLWAAGGYVLSGCSDVPKTTPDVVIIPAGGVQQRALPWTYTGPNDYLVNLSEALSSPGMAISGGTLYIGQSLLLSNNDEVDQIAAIDLGTARLRWYKTLYWGEQSTNRHTEIQGVNPNNALFSVNVVGATPKGVIDVIQSVGCSGNSCYGGGTTGMTLALLSASDGSISYGPGTTYTAGIDNQPSLILSGGILLSFPVCPTAFCSPGKYTGTVTAYNLGSWPG